MPLPFVLSPYLRPFRDKDTLCIDNGLTQRSESLSEVEEEVVCALWDAEEAERELEALARRRPLAEIEEALRQLFERAMLFESLEQCDEVFDRVLDFAVGRVPFLDQIELTNHCPMRCGFCPRGVPGRMKREKGFMDIDLYERLLAELHPLQASYRMLELHHLGESLLHPEVARFVELASARGLPTEMSLNPALLDPELCQRLLHAGISRLVISLDGMDEATLHRLRGPAARFGRAERNLDLLLSEVARMKEPPQVVIQMIDLAGNRHQHEAFMKRYGATGLPTVTAYIKDLDGPDPDTGEEGARPLRYLCTYPFRSVVVLWDGRVVPCCRDDDARLVLGDLRRSTLADIWHGEPAQRLRHLHRSGRFPHGHLCDGCSWSRASFRRTMKDRRPERAGRAPLYW